jgi:hypothetical protein
MSQSPGPLVASQVAAMADGTPAEVALDIHGDAFARWRISPDLRGNPWWSEWQHLGSDAVAVAIAPADRSSAGAYVTVTTGGRSPSGRTVYLLTAGGAGATAL